MREPNIKPWFGLDDLSSLAFDTELPKPLYNEKNTADQEKALDNPEQSIDKDSDKPWVQKNKKSNSSIEDSGVNGEKRHHDPPIDDWAQPEHREDIPPAR